MKNIKILALLCAVASCSVMYATEKKVAPFEWVLGRLFSCKPVMWRVTGQPPMLHDRDTFLESFIISGYPPGTRTTQFAFVREPGNHSNWCITFFEGEKKSAPFPLSGWFSVSTNDGGLELKRSVKGGGEGGLWRASEATKFSISETQDGRVLLAIFEGTVVNTQLFVFRSKATWRVEASFMSNSGNHSEENAKHANARK